MEGHFDDSREEIIVCGVSFDQTEIGFLHGIKPIILFPCNSRRMKERTVISAIRNEWMVTSAIKMAVSNVDGVDEKVFNGLSFHPPDSKPHYWHLVAAAQSDGCHFFSSFSAVENLVESLYRYKLIDYPASSSCTCLLLF